jgi:hypothetical protein
LEEVHPPATEKEKGQCAIKSEEDLDDSEDDLDDSEDDWENEDERSSNITIHRIKTIPGLSLLTL